MKKLLLLAIGCWLLAVGRAQESQTAYNFLRLPVSAHVAALGGDNVSLTNDDVSLIFSNPSLMSNVTSMTIGLNYMTYMEGTKTASASFVKQVNSRGKWGVMAQYLDYGDITERNTSGEALGDLAAKDIMIGGAFSYRLTDNLSGGVTGKYISSSIAGYSSSAVAVDLGLCFTDTLRNMSVGLVARNLGGQISAYDDNFENIPLDIQLGITKRLGSHSPLVFSITMAKLNDWDIAFREHFAIGADILLGETFYLAAGYNFRRANEMKITDGDGASSHGAGLSLGGGMKLQRLSLDIGYAKYHVSSSSLLFNVSYLL